MAGNVAIFAERIADCVRPFARLFRGPDGAVLAVGGEESRLDVIVARPSRAPGYFVAEDGGPVAYVAGRWAMVGESALGDSPSPYPFVRVAGRISRRDLPQAAAAFECIGGYTVSTTSRTVADFFATLPGRDRVILPDRANALPSAAIEAVGSIAVVSDALRATRPRKVVLTHDLAGERLAEIAEWGPPPPAPTVTAFTAFAHAPVEGVDHGRHYGGFPRAADRRELRDALAAYLSRHNPVDRIEVHGRVRNLFHLPVRMSARWDRPVAIPSLGAEVRSRGWAMPDFDISQFRFAPQRDIGLYVAEPGVRAVIAPRCLGPLWGDIAKVLGDSGGYDFNSRVVLAASMLVDEPRVTRTCAIYENIHMFHTEIRPWWPRRA